MANVLQRSLNNGIEHFPAIMRIISAIALMRFWSTTLSELNYHVTRFILSAPDIRHLPSDTGIEVAFAGRSNAGNPAL